MKTKEEIKSEFAERGLSISGWAKERGYSQALVYQVLSGNRRALRGESHKIAVELGLKKGKTGCYGDLSFYKVEVIQ
jgi:gp16 family phage-associated protein